MKVLVTSNSFGKCSKKPIADLEAAGFKVVLNRYGRQMTEDEFIAELDGADAVILSTERVNAHVLDCASSLKFISRYGVGLDTIDLGACEERGVKVQITAHANSTAVAEYAVSLLLAAAKGIGYSDACAHNGIWEKFNGIDVTGKTVGIIGLGSIGKEVAHLLSGFNMRFLAYDIVYDEEFCTVHKIERASIERIVRECDVIMLHAPSSDKPILAGEQFSNMKDNVVIVNAARASLIDTDALYDALVSGKVFAAGLDVHDNEPMYDERLMKLHNVVLTPHNAAISREAIDRTSQMAVDHILEFFKR